MNDVHSDDSSAFAELAAELQADTDELLTAETIVRRLVDLVPEAEHASLTVRARGQGHKTLASSDETSERADGLQYALTEGPCLETADHINWTRSGDVAGDARWPEWGPRARTLGIGSVLSVQLTSRDRPHGALNIYSKDIGRFEDPETVDIALIYAVHAANALGAARLVTGLQTALTSRHHIGVAQGIVMERYGLDVNRSFELLRRISSSHEMKLRAVAEHVVTTGQLPEGTAHEASTGKEHDHRKVMDEPRP